MDGRNHTECTAGSAGTRPGLRQRHLSLETARTIDESSLARGASAYNPA